MPGTGATLVASLPIVNMELLVVGGSHDMIPTLEENMLDSGADTDVKWGAGEGGTLVVVSRGVIQFCEDREEVEGDGGMGGVVFVCFCVTLPGEKGAGCTAGEVWSVSMTTWGDPDELGALPDTKRKHQSEKVKHNL